MLAHPRVGLRLLVSWPWLLVTVAWALVLLTTWTGQGYLINHDYLLEECGLPWLAAFLLFLACWQVMTTAMMLPSSLPRSLRLVLGGVFECSPLKQRALSVCRRAGDSFGSPPCSAGGSAWELGLDEGQRCVGSCCALMLVMFRVGTGSVIWIAALAGVMAGEKLLPSGWRLRLPVGLILLLLAALWACSPAWRLVVAAR